MRSFDQGTLPRQFDAWIRFDRTGAVTPLAGEGEPAGAADGTWPFGL